MFVSFPNYDFFYLQWFALVPLLFAMEGASVRAAMGWGFWTGTVTNVGGFYWITGLLMDFGHFSMWIAAPLCVLLCAYQGLVFSFWAGLVRWLMKRNIASVLWVVPVVWAVVEYTIPMVFPWYFGNGQYLFYPAIQIVEITGVIGLSYLMLVVNAGCYVATGHALRKQWHQARKPMAIVATVFIANLAYGSVRIAQVDELQNAAETLRIGMVEANVGIFEKQARHVKTAKSRWNLLRGNILKHQLLARELERKYKVDLIVEPESSFISVPWPFNYVEFKRNNEFAFAAGSGRNIWQNTHHKWSGPEPLGGEGQVINGISAARENMVLAVGARGIVHRFDGTNWTPEKSGVSVDLNDVWAGTRAPDYRQLDGVPVIAWAVGDNGTAIRRETNGEWRRTVTGSQVNLRGVSGRSSRRIYAVGDGGTALRWNGTRWQSMDTGTRTRLNDVWTEANGPLVAVGDNGLMLHKTGNNWKRVNLFNGAFRSVDAAANTLLAVGDAGTIFAWNKGKWSQQKSGTKARLRSVSFDAHQNAYAVGDGGILLTQERGAQGWTKTVLRDAGRLNAVVGLPFTRGHAYRQNSTYVARSFTPLPKLAPGDLMSAVADIQPTLDRDVARGHSDWNTPVRGYNTPTLLGLLSYSVTDPDVWPLADKAYRKSYNTAMLLDKEGRVMGSYDKTFLLAFGEFLPFGETFPQLYDWIPQANHFYPGNSVDSFAFKGHKLGVMICYEDILPGFARKLAGKDPNIFINVTNDAWFGKTSEPYLHLALSIFRTVEHRLWLVRSTNTGVSAFVDAVGRIVAQTGLDDPEILVQDVPVLYTTTFYRRYGELFTYLCFLLFGLMVIRAFTGARSSR